MHVSLLRLCVCVEIDLHGSYVNNHPYHKTCTLQSNQPKSSHNQTSNHPASHPVLESTNCIVNVYRCIHFVWFCTAYPNLWYFLLSFSFLHSCCCCCYFLLLTESLTEFSVHFLEYFVAVFSHLFFKLDGQYTFLFSFTSSHNIHSTRAFDYLSTLSLFFPYFGVWWTPVHRLIYELKGQI